MKQVILIVLVVSVFSCKPPETKHTLSEVLPIYQSDIEVAAKENNIELVGTYFRLLEKEIVEQPTDAAILKAKQFLAKRDSFSRLPNIIGKYMSKELDGCEMTFYEQGSKIWLKTVFVKKGGSAMEQPVKRSNMKGKIRFDYLDGEMHGEYFIIEDDGNLGEYNKDGKRFGVAMKM